VPRYGQGRRGEKYKKKKKRRMKKTTLEEKSGMQLQKSEGTNERENEWKGKDKNGL